MLPARFVTIDALRGIAALAVVAYHLQGAVVRDAPDWVLSRPMELGYLGVDIFFVISGFVIAHSVWGADHTIGYFGRFALRRSLRLDPPYWSMIALEVGLLALTLRMVPSFDAALPSRDQIATHFLYLQNLTGRGDILPVFWTLCYEVQFYVFFMLLLVVWRRVRAPRWAAIVVLAALFGWSLATRFLGFPLWTGLALDRWFQFFLGTLTYWVVRREASSVWLAMAWGAVAALIIGPWTTSPQYVAVLASALVVAVAARNALGTFGGNSVLQYLGRRSYSLYLIHLPIGWRIVSAGQLFGIRNPWMLFVASTGGSIMAAEILYRAIEKPSVGWSRRIRGQQSPVQQPEVELPKTLA